VTGNRSWNRKRVGRLGRTQRKRWYILNGSMEGDWEGEYIYVGYRGTVIDYVIANENIRENVREFIIEWIRIICRCLAWKKRRGRSQRKRKKSKE